MKRVIRLLAFVGMTSVALAAAEIGKPAPAFTGVDIHGRTHQLSDYKGKVVVLEAYNSDCPFVGNHYRSGAMQDLQKELTAKGVVWLLVDSVNSNNFSHRTPEQARAEWQEKKIQATAWLDDSAGIIAKAYGMKTTPHMFVIDQKGTLVYDGAIDDRPRPNGDPRTARNYVREAVEKTLAGEKVEVTETKPYGCAVKYGG
jgi:peroxiredoxin